MATDRNVLLVEGKDDLNVVAHLLRHHLKIEKVEDVVNIQDKESIDKLLRSLRSELQRSGLEKIGIIVDADEELKNRWEALRDRLINLEDITVTVPETPDKNGTIFTADRLDRMISVGIWLMPDNNQNGMLEDFVSFLVPSKDTLWERAKNCVADIPERERPFGSFLSKAEIHTWLAWQREPGRPLGTAIRARFLDADAPHAQKFVGWLKRLFEV